jgi:hypothetical protein
VRNSGGTDLRTYQIIFPQVDINHVMSPLYVSVGFVMLVTSRHGPRRKRRLSFLQCSCFREEMRVFGAVT